MSFTRFAEVQGSRVWSLVSLDPLCPCALMSLLCISVFRFYGELYPSLTESVPFPLEQIHSPDCGLGEGTVNPCACGGKGLLRPLCLWGSRLMTEIKGCHRVSKISLKLS